MNKKIVLIVAAVITLICVCTSLVLGFAFIFNRSNSNTSDSNVGKIVKLERGVSLSPVTQFTLELYSSGDFIYTDYKDKKTEGELSIQDMVNLTVDINTFKYKKIEIDSSKKGECCDIPSRSITFYDNNEFREYDIYYVKDESTQKELYDLFDKIASKVKEKLDNSDS